MRVNELAQDLGVIPQDILVLLRAMGIPVPDEGAPVVDADVARVLARVERERRAGRKDATEAVRAAIDESDTPTRRRRRRRAADVVPELPAAPVTEEPGEFGQAVEADVGAGVQVFDEPSAIPAGLVETPLAGMEVEPDEAEVSVEDGAGLPTSELPVESAGTEEAVETPAAEEGERADAERLPTPVDASQVAEEDAEGRPKRRLRMPDMGPLTPAAGERRPVEAPWERTEPEPVASARPTPAASAGPGGQVRIQAEGFTPDGKKQVKKKGKKRQRVDQGAVQDNIQRVMAELKGGGKRRRRKAPAGPSREEREAQEQEEQQIAAVEAQTVRVNEFLTVAELSELIDVPSTELVGAAFKNLGLMVTINQRLDFDQLELLLDEFNYKAVREEEYAGAIDVLDEEEDDPASLLPRPPVVTVMGHVDHGKTLLLDSIRNTNVVAGESGGITQHIGAYHVELDGQREITFLDTPGHAAFTAMRARGADVTDIVVLVVAADDSIMPQTIEAISHAKNAGVPVVVAVNKTDLPAANPMQVKQELLRYDVTVEEYGGEVLVAEVSAKTGDGIEDLLDKVLLQAEILDLKANPDRGAQGTVVEAKLDVGKGSVVTVLVQRGTLRVGDDFVCGQFEGRVRALLDERGKPAREALPGSPVQLLGVGGVPQAGDTLAVMDAVRASEIAQTRQRLEREKQIRVKERGVKLGDLAQFMRQGEVTTLPIVVKADADGSVQAVSDSLEQLSTAEIKVEIVHRAVGAVNESDVLLAETARAIIIGFGVRPDTNARLLAEQAGVEVRLYDVIYEAVEDVIQAMEGMLSPEERENVIGVAEVREIFKISRVGTIAGCYVSTGVVDRKGRARLLRNRSTIYGGEFESLKRFKDDVREVREGYECGIGIANFNDVKVGDVIECYLVEEVARTLTRSAAASGQGR